MKEDNQEIASMERKYVTLLYKAEILTLVFFNDVQVQTCMCIACSCGRRSPLRNGFVSGKSAQKNSKTPESISKMCPNVIHVCTPKRRGDQREGLVGIASSPLFVKK